MIHDQPGWRGIGLPPTALTLLRWDAKGENTPITKHDTKLMVTNVFSRRKRGGKGWRKASILLYGRAFVFLKQLFSSSSLETPLLDGTFSDAG